MARSSLCRNRRREERQEQAAIRAARSLHTAACGHLTSLPDAEHYARCGWPIGGEA